MSRASDVLERLTDDEIAHLRKTGGQDMVKDIQSVLRKNKVFYDDIEFDKKGKQFIVGLDAKLSSADITKLTRGFRDIGLKIVSSSGEVELKLRLSNE